jgi:glycosyltransferase involved in cell wall biosynthesis
MPLRELAVDASRAVRPFKTGTEWYSVEVIRAMAQVPNRPALMLYAPNTGAPGDLPPDVPRRVVRFPRLWTHVGLSAALARDRPDALFVPSHVIPAYHPRASIVTIHDLGYRVEPAAHPRRQRLMLDLTTRWNARVARRIIAISGQTRNDLIKYYAAEQAKIAVIHSGVDHTRFRQLPSDVVHASLAALGVSQPYLLAVSTLQPRKNLARLVEAFRLLDHPGLSLVIAGKSGWCAEPLVGSAGGDVYLMGYVASSHLPSLYNGAEALVLPSLYEGFGMWVLEAMACGCPVVTSNSSSLPEVAGDAAVLVDPLDVAAIRDGIVRVMAPAERDRLVAVGRRRASGFTWERTAQQTLALIEEAACEA